MVYLVLHQTHFKYSIVTCGCWWLFWTTETCMISQHPSLFQWRAPSVCTSSMHLLNWVLILHLQTLQCSCPWILFSWPCLNGLQVCGIYLGGGEQAAFQHSRWPEPSCCCCVHRPGAGPWCNLPTEPTITRSPAETSRGVPLIGTPLRQLNSREGSGFLSATELGTVAMRCVANKVLKLTNEWLFINDVGFRIIPIINKSGLRVPPKRGHFHSNRPY